MAYINTETGQYPVSEQQIRNLFPNTSFPAQFIPPEPYAWVFPTPAPGYNPVTQRLVEDNPALTSKGHWEQNWDIANLSAAEIAANQAVAATRVQQEVVGATQARLDNFARERNYDGILSACTYATSSVPKFQAEGQCCVDARDATWSTLYTLLGEVQAGTRPIPASYADIEPLLPALVWPA